MGKVTPKHIFEHEFVEKIKKHQKDIQGAKGIVEFNIDGPNGGAWTLNMSKNGAISSGAAKTSDLKVFIKEDDLIALMDGSLSPMKAFISGKIKFEGDLGLGMQLSKIF